MHDRLHSTMLSNMVDLSFVSIAQMRWHQSLCGFEQLSGKLVVGVIKHMLLRSDPTYLVFPHRQLGMVEGH